MPRFAVNVSMIGHEKPLADRLRAVADAGFPAIEFWFPHQFDMDEMARLTGELGLQVALFDLEPSESHPYGHVADPEGGPEFFRRLDDALRMADRLGCRVLNVLQGARIPSLALERQIDSAVEKLSRAAPLAAAAGVTLTIEAINALDRPGSFCDRTSIGLRVVDAVASPSVRFQYDVYHMQLMEGDVLRTVEAAIDRIGHVQLADPPGRHEPGTGEVNVWPLLDLLDRLAYAGWVSLEYWPSDGVADPFAWLPRDRRQG